MTYTNRNEKMPPAPQKPDSVTVCGRVQRLVSLLFLCGTIQSCHVDQDAPAIDPSLMWGILFLSALVGGVIIAVIEQKNDRDTD